MCTAPLGVRGMPCGQAAKGRAWSKKSSHSLGEPSLSILHILIKTSNVWWFICRQWWIQEYDIPRVAVALKRCLEIKELRPFSSRFRGAKVRIHRRARPAESMEVFSCSGEIFKQQLPRIAAPSRPGPEGFWTTNFFSLKRLATLVGCCHFIGMIGSRTKRWATDTSRYEHQLQLPTANLPFLPVVDQQWDAFQVTV